MALVISFLVTFWVAYLIYKKYKPQPVLVVGGFILMYTAVVLGYGQILAPKASTGAILFDTFQFMSQTLSSRAAKLGLNIMCVGAFAKYMDRIGASRALVRMTIKPLLKLKSPYLVLSLSWVLGLCIGLCINSASGLAPCRTNSSCHEGMNRASGGTRQALERLCIAARTASSFSGCTIRPSFQDSYA